jgi:esterase/lipase superfamily enzyme
MVSNKLYLDCYLLWLSGRFTIKELVNKYGKSASTIGCYIKYGRNLAITKYNSQFKRASMITDTAKKEKAFDEDLKEFFQKENIKREYY